MEIVLLRFEKHVKSTLAAIDEHVTIGVPNATQLN